MSRLYVTASMKHTSFGIALPTFSIETADHTGGGYHVKGIHPSSLAALSGNGPEIRIGERFDIKFNVNGQRTSLALVINTTKHLPHLEWSSEGGMGKLPFGIATVAPLLLANSKHQKRDAKIETPHAGGEGALSKDARRPARRHSLSHSHYLPTSRDHRSSRSERANSSRRSEDPRSRREEPNRELKRLMDIEHKAPSRRESSRMREPPSRSEPAKQRRDRCEDYDADGDGYERDEREKRYNDSGYGMEEYGGSDKMRREKGRESYEDERDARERRRTRR